MPRKGGTVQWSNRYFFTGGNLTHAQFLALNTLLQNEEQLLFSSAITIVEMIRYDIGSDVPVETASASVAGNLSMTGKSPCPSDAAACVRFSTDQRTSKNHPIYLFKYMHGVVYTTGGSEDSVNSTQLTRYQNYAADCVAGFNDGTSTRHITGPYGAVALGSFVHPYITHRDFP